MATISFTLSTAAATELNDAMAFHFNYQATIPDPQNPGQTIPNPENKTQFSKKMVLNHLKERIHSYRRAQKLNEVSITDPDIT